MKDINEMIADAKAEEEVEQEEKKDNFKEELKSKLSEVFKYKPSAKVEVGLEDYLILKAKELDLERLLNIISDTVYLGYDEKSLRTDGDKIMQAIEVLYPEAYAELLARTKAEKEDK